MCLLTENLMLEKKLPAQFRFIYLEVTEDNSKAPGQIGPYPGSSLGTPVPRNVGFAYTNNTL